MNTKLLNHRKVLASILFIFALSVQLKAQDTIHCLDSRYYWNNELCSWGEADYIYPCSHNKYSFPDTDTNNVNDGVWILKQNIFPADSTNVIYGIAGATIGCYNPNGCYFYLYKKIGTTFELLDSVEWTHKSPDKPKYIDYNTARGNPYSSDLLSSYTGVDNMGNHIYIPYPDSGSNIVNIYEAYFKNPIVVRDTFYIGMNRNRLSWVSITHSQYDVEGSEWHVGNPHDATFIAGIAVHFPDADTAFLPGSDLDYYPRWFIFNNGINALPRDISYYPHFKGFFPILSPHPCAPISTTFVDSLTHNSVYISWEQSYLSLYYQIEYGLRGFQRGSGVFIDSITTSGYALQGLEAGTEYFAYIRGYCPSTDTFGSWRLVQFKTLDTLCPVVENLKVNYARDNRAGIGWDITNGEITLCQIEWGEAGFEHGSGTVVNNIHDSTYVFRNLTPNTGYDVYIRTYCERSGVFGAWQQLTFTTDASTNAIATADNDISVELHPNPTSGIITLSRNDVEKVEVIDAVGKTVMVVENKHIIDLTKLGQGHYTLRITLPEGVAIRKVIRK